MQMQATSKFIIMTQQWLQINIENLSVL